MICPKCKGEYREGFDRCYQCDVPLVEVEDAGDDLWELEIDEDSEDPWEYLTTTNDFVQAEFLISFLRGEGIPVLDNKSILSSLYKVRGPGGEIDLYVPKVQHERAVEAMKAFFEGEKVEDQEEERSEDGECPL